MRAVVDAEVAVVGAGPAGCAAAITLVRAGVDVAVLTGTRRSPTGAYRPGEGAPPGVDTTVRQVFGSGGAAFDPTAHLRSYATRSAWGGPEIEEIDHMFNPFGPGWLLDRDAFDARLLDAVADAGARVVCGASVVESRHDTRWHLSTARAGRSSVVTAQVVCDASGRHAVVARAHGGRVVRRDRLTAIAGAFATGDGEPDPTITVEAVRDGWWYTAPLPRGGRVVILFTDPDVIDVTAARHPDHFLALMRATHHVAATLAAAATKPIGRPTVFPAGTTHLEPAAGRDWFAVGDAAATFDPLSSQGILTALLTGREAGRAAIAAVGGAHDPMAEYAATLRSVLGTYRREHAAYYAAERRWASSPFWQRRHSSDQLAARATS
jgi:flavin-dependent dehydrogenase